MFKLQNTRMINWNILCICVFSNFHWRNLSIEPKWIYLFIQESFYKTYKTCQINFISCLNWKMLVHRTAHKLFSFLWTSVKIATLKLCSRYIPQILPTTSYFYQPSVILQITIIYSVLTADNVHFGRSAFHAFEIYVNYIKTHPLVCTYDEWL